MQLTGRLNTDHRSYDVNLQCRYVFFARSRIYFAVNRDDECGDSSLQADSRHSQVIK